MPEKHPLFWKVEAFRARRGEAQARAQLAALTAQTTTEQYRAREVAFAALLTEIGLDPNGTYALDDEAETITRGAPSGEEGKA